jgi:hypothetical protein
MSGGHRVIYGQTLSGKSVLARKIATAHKNGGFEVIAYDPTMSDEWPGLCTDNFDAFLRYLNDASARGAKISAFVDEADTALSMANRDKFWLFTRGRHYRITATAITQRPMLIAPTVRNNAAEHYVFQLGRGDASVMANDLSCDAIKMAPTLCAGEFVHVRWVDKVRTGTKRRVF